VKLPNGDRVRIDDAKLRAYCLDPTNSVGRHKALVFERVLGLTQENVDELRELLVDAAQNEDALLIEDDGEDQTYRIDFAVARGGRTVTVRSTWMVEERGERTRLITCFVRRASK
jgi:hypothetical protein